MDELAGIRKHKLLTKELIAKLPPLYSGEESGVPVAERVVAVKFFSPYSGWTWYALEGSPETNEAGEVVDYTFFGWVDGFDSELGYFVLSELETVEVEVLRGFPKVPAVERDKYFTSRPLGEVTELPDWARKPVEA
jgi:hypothetical protein